MRLAFKIAIIAAMLSGWALVRAEENLPNGFLNIPFGATSEAWLAELTSRFKMKPSFPLGLYQWPMSGSDMELLRTSDNIYCLKNYALGDRRVTVLFYFNDDGKFYGFRLKGENEKRPRKPDNSPADLKQVCISGLDSIESKNLLEDELFLQKVFEKKYGKPTRAQQFSADEICQNAGRIFWVQKGNRYLAAVGTIRTLSAGAAKNSPDMYSPIAVVFDLELKGESVDGASLMSPEGSLRTRVQHKLIENAAGSF